MKAPVTHINLLEGASGASHWAAWALAGLLTLSMVGAGGYGIWLRAAAGEAVRQRDDVAAEVQQVRSRMATLGGEQAKTAGALAVRNEVDALQISAQAARALISAVGHAQSGRSEEFSRTLDALGSVSESGLWLIALNVTAGGKRLEVQGEARTAAAVLRYARRANDVLKPLALRLDNLEMQPATAVGAEAGTVAFRLN